MESLQKQLVSAAVKELLETKHLYQSVRVDCSKVPEVATAHAETIQFTGPLLSNMRDALRERPSEQRKRYAVKLEETTVKALEAGTWVFEVEVAQRSSMNAPSALNAPSSLLFVRLPPVKVICQFCKNTVQPHNSGSMESTEAFPGSFLPNAFSPAEKMVQIFQFPYQCQGCRREPVIFQVRREGLKLTLTGRSQIETVSVPKIIPEQEAIFYSEAAIAFNSGRILAGLFFQRSLIEQYMRRVLGAKERLTGDELGDRYSALLDDEFPKKFKGLKTIYSDLSERLHEAKSDAELFISTKNDVERHFELLQHFPLKRPTKNI